jgi:hypothetical protein
VALQSSDNGDMIEFLNAKGVSKILKIRMSGTAFCV